MAKMCRLVLLPALLLAAGSAFADMKIAVVNVQRAIGECNEGKAMIAKIESDTASDQTEIKKLGTDITAMQDKFNKNRDVMSDAEKGKLQKEIEDKQIDYQFRVNKLQKLVNERQQDILQQMAPKLDAVLKDVIAQDQYDLVIHRQNVLFVDPKYDITAKVTEKLNAKK